MSKPFKLIILLFFAIGPTTSFAKPPNILFLLSDDQRPDTIHALGNEIIQTPNLDGLVKQGTTFTRATCGNPICTPSRAEIMSGCSGFKNKVLDFGRVIDPEIPLWSTTMKKAGYRTGYVGKWHTDGRPHLRGYTESHGLFNSGGRPTRGKPLDFPFDINGLPVTGYKGWCFQTSQRDKFFPELGIGLTPNISEKFADAAMNFLNEKTEAPFFLHVNFTTPHDPLFYPKGYENLYKPSDMKVPPNFLSEHPIDHGNLKGRDESLWPWPRTKEMVQKDLSAYYAQITHMDAQIGRIIQTLTETNQMKNTVIIFSSDHGLAVGSHGLRGKQNMYEHTIGVPLIFSGPGIQKQKRTDAQCYLRDLYPTTCELCEIQIPKSIEGKSLIPILKGENSDIYHNIYGYYRDVQRMIRTDRWKYISYPKADRDQLFDLKNDPDEMNDLSQSSEYIKTKKDLALTLLDWQLSVGDPVLSVSKKE